MEFFWERSKLIDENGYYCLDLQILITKIRKFSFQATKILIHRQDCESKKHRFLYAAMKWKFVAPP